MELLYQEKMYSAIQSMVWAGFTHKSKLFPAAEQDGGNRVGFSWEPLLKGGNLRKKGGNFNDGHLVASRETEDRKEFWCRCQVFAGPGPGPFICMFPLPSVWPTVACKDLGQWHQWNHCLWTKHLYLELVISSPPRDWKTPRLDVCCNYNYYVHYNVKGAHYFLPSIKLPVLPKNS